MRGGGGGSRGLSRSSGGGRYAYGGGGGGRHAYGGGGDRKRYAYKGGKRYGYDSVSPLRLLWLVRRAIPRLRRLRWQLWMDVSQRCSDRRPVLVEPLLRVHWLLALTG